ncbi:hypothetical protein, partial [Pseudomonas sp. 2822-15]|uniref:hypothetical protein n=1 Tax=Pseudomonas sp. 2822-15 TaxID=1712677 RepID=UPI001C444030
VEAVCEEIKDKGVDLSIIKKIKKLLTSNINNTEYFEQFPKENTLLQEGIAELNDLENYLVALNITDRCKFNPFLAR